MICKTHGRIRCSECAYVEELKEEIWQLRKALMDIAESDDPWFVDSVSMRDYARQALGKE